MKGMGKLCQCCNQREAKIHFTELKDKKKTEMHLCEVCAQEKNMMLAFPSLLSTLVKGGAEAAAGEAEAISAVCPRCGLAYSEFKAKGRIGCPGCYDAFAAVLIPLLDKVHNASAHTGKCPPHEAEPDIEPPPPSEPILSEEEMLQLGISKDQLGITGEKLKRLVSEGEIRAVSEQEALRAELAKAVAAEDYERCAELRDRIRALDSEQGDDSDEV